MRKDDGWGNLVDLFDPEDDAMMFYKQDGKNKFLYCRINGEHESYSIYVGAWKGTPPADPEFTKMTEYRFPYEESKEWGEMSDSLVKEARALGAVAWVDVKTPL